MIGTVFHPYFWLASLLIRPIIIAGIINHGIVEEHDLPAQMHVGQTALATWSLETGSSGGFARFQAQFPEGVVAESLEDSGASFICSVSSTSTRAGIPLTGRPGITV